MARQWDDATGVVTPEAVELRLQEANAGSRTAALLVDFAILGALLWGLNLTIGWVVERVQLVVPDWVGVTVLIVVNFLLLFGYPIAFEALSHGRTPGKATMGLRVVTVEGSPVRFRHAAIRGVFWLVDFFATVGAAALLTTLLSRRHQRLGDMVAGTVVVRERTAAPTPYVAQFSVPAGAESYAASLDPSGLTPQDYEVLREFLLRRRSLPSAKSHELAHRLAQAYGERLHHTRASDITADTFLVCLAVRYQQQDRRGGIMAAPSAGTPGAAPAPPATGSESPPQPDQPGEFAPPQ